MFNLLSWFKEPEVPDDTEYVTFLTQAESQTVIPIKEDSVNYNIRYLIAKNKMGLGFVNLNYHLPCVVEKAKDIIADVTVDDQSEMVKIQEGIYAADKITISNIRELWKSEVANTLMSYFLTKEIVMSPHIVFSYTHNNPAMDLQHLFPLSCLLYKKCGICTANIVISKYSRSFTQEQLLQIYGCV